MLVNSLKVNSSIFLKQVQIPDLQKLYKVVEDNQKDLKKWFPWASRHRLSLENEKKFIEESLEKNKNGKGCDLIIYYDKQIAGMISLLDVKKRKKEAEIGYWLSAEYRGKGIVTKICKKLIRHCFIKLDFNKVFIAALAQNSKSRAIPERLGFEIVDTDEEGTNLNGRRSYYVWYSQTQYDYKENFWDKLDDLVEDSKIIIDIPKNEKYIDLDCKKLPASLGHLENDWDKNEQLDIWIGNSTEKSEYPIDSIICIMNIDKKFSDIKILQNCTEEEKKAIFCLYREKEGAILINRY